MNRRQLSFSMIVAAIMSVFTGFVREAQAKPERGFFGLSYTTFGIAPDGSLIQPGDNGVYVPDGMVAGFAQAYRVAGFAQAFRYGDPETYDDGTFWDGYYVDPISLVQPETVSDFLAKSKFSAFRENAIVGMGLHESVPAIRVYFA